MKIMKKILLMFTYLCIIPSNLNLDQPEINSSKNISKKMRINESYYENLVDNYEVQEINLQNLELDTQNNSRTVNTYYDNGRNDDDMEHAINANYQEATINGILSINSAWDQFWYGVGERDEDYFIFSTPYKLQYEFNFTNPSTYYVRLLEYRGSDDFGFICNFQNRTVLELEPGTYYLHIYCNENAEIVSDSYSLSYSSQRISNNDIFELSVQNMETYKYVLWENEKYPKNGDRNNDANEKLMKSVITSLTDDYETGFLDPIFSYKTYYLDRIIYTWDYDIANELSLILEGMEETLLEIAEENYMIEGNVELILDGANLALSIIGSFSGQITSNPNAGKIIAKICEGISFTSSAISFVQTLFNSPFFVDFEESEDYENGIYIAYLNSLQTAVYWFGNTENQVLCLPSFYKFQKEYIYNDYQVNSGYYTLVDEYTYKINSKNTHLIINDDYTFCHEGDYISSIQSLENIITSYGELIAFHSVNELNEYMVGNGNNGDSGNSVDFHNYNNATAVDNNTHKEICSCGKERINEHYFNYENGVYSCKVCGFIREIEEDTISVSNYGYEGQYFFEEKTKDITTTLGNNVTTKRLRTGIVNGNLALSAKRKNAGRAYLEYYFEEKVIQINFSMGLWSDSESLIENSSIRLEGLLNDQWVTIRSFDARNMSTSYSTLMDYSVTLNYPLYAFRFIVETNQVNNDNNKGRVVIGDITIVKEKHFHEYSDWEYDSISNHKKTCDCGHEVFESHNCIFESLNETHHSYLCNDCGYTGTSEHIWVVTSAPTDILALSNVVSPQYVPYYICTVCGYETSKPPIGYVDI